MVSVTLSTRIMNTVYGHMVQGCRVDGHVFQWYSSQWLHDGWPHGNDSHWVGWYQEMQAMLTNHCMAAALLSAFGELLLFN